MTTTTLQRTTMPSPVGELTLVASDAGLRAVLWPGDDPDRVRFAEPVEDAPDGGADHPVLAAARLQLAEYFAGSRRRFDLPLDPVGSEFRLRAWEALATIPYGETATYGEQARSLGRPTAARAVGAAVGENPLSIIVPCHRVVGSDGSLVGFAGGLEAKSWLLDHERRHTRAS
jgi:methylated-DNA-[protein]-cysteine S-methyltransferase